MTDEQRQMLEQVLPPRKQGVVPPSDAMADDFTLDDVDPTREGTRATGATEEDDDEMGGQGERVQCASQ